MGGVGVQLSICKGSPFAKWWQNLTDVSIRRNVSFVSFHLPIRYRLYLLYTLMCNPFWSPHIKTQGISVKVIIMSPHLWGREHIDFGVVEIRVRLSCLHNILWTSGWIHTKFSWIYNWDRAKDWIEFGYLDLIFKVIAVENWSGVGGVGVGVGDIHFLWKHCYSVSSGLAFFLDFFSDILFYILPHDGFMLAVHVRLSYLSICLYFCFQMMTWVIVNGFSPNLKCALIL